MAKSKIALKDRRPLFDHLDSFQTHYLGWEKPILQSACDFLLKNYRRGEQWDLSRCIVVLPGGLAGRRLATLMAQAAGKESLVTRPPEIITVGKLPELLYSARLPFASDLEQTLAWTKVLRSASAEFLQPLLIELPDRAEVRPWIDLAKLMSSLHRELSSDLVDFEDVKQAISDPREVVRWEILAQLQLRYLAELHEAGLWDLQTARRYAIDQDEVDSDREIILIGTPDLNQAQRRFLEKVKDQVQVLIGAPESYSDGFHSDGTLAVAYWQDLAIDIAQDQIHVRSTATESAKELASQLAMLGNGYSVSEVTIGIPDPSVVPVLQETLGDFGVTLRYGPGEPITQSPPMKLLELIIEYVATGSIEAFNQLVRVPSVEAWLVEQPKIAANLQRSPKSISLLASLDKYQEATLIRTVAQIEWPQILGHELFVAVVEAIDQWLQPLRCSSRPLEKWADPIRQVLKTSYNTMQVSPENELGNSYLRSAQQINAMLDELANLPSNLDVEVVLHEAYTWLYGQLEMKQIAALHQENEIEMMGWLELVLDDAPILMLTGLQDGIVPESVNGDAFLPNQLRSVLGLMDNSRRYARDCYAMLTMLHTREQLEIILNHLGVDGDPRTPSRLLMAVPPDQLAPRVRWLLEPKENSLALEASKTWIPRIGQTNIPIPIPVGGKPVLDMAVTDFKKYDQCPYRFYLGRIEKARAFEHEKLELDGGGFGDLVHKCVESLGDDPAGMSTDPEVVEKFLLQQLADLARKQFGVQRPPALVIQIEQAERRLKEFAKHQADWAAQGWEIKYIEYTVEKKDGIRLPAGDGREMLIHGRIDRIDYNAKKNLFAVLDYKTGDSTDKPRANHLKKSTWIDWQLPLYGVLVRALELNDLSKIKFGYILLPKNPTETEFILADFSVEEHAAALESASQIATKVLNAEFWPPKYKNIHPLDEYNSITQLSVARRWDRSIAEQEASQSFLPHAQTGETVSMEEPELADVDSDGKSLAPIALKRSKRSTKQKLVPQKIRLDPVLAKGEPAADWFTPMMILASAGTGKTFNLAARALRLLFSDQPLDSILATTFTRKAAGEILHRVLSWLAKAIEEPNELVKLQQVLAPLEVDAETVKYQLGRLCSHLHRFRVSTLDSFYSQLARSFALELNLPPGWSLSDPYQTDQLKHEAISRMFESMTHQQLRSLVSQLSKGEATRSIRREIESVVSTGYDLYRRTSEENWNNLTVPKAPDEESVHKALSFFRTSTLTKEKRYESARNTAVSHFENGDWSAFLSHTLVKKIHDDEPKYYKDEIGVSIIDAMGVLAKRAITGELTIRRAQNEAAYSLLANYHQQMQLVKARHRTVTFDDISERLSKWMASVVLQKKKELTSEQPGSPANFDDEKGHPPKTTMDGISYRLDCPIDHLLLDEFQDTSPVQWEIVKPFAEAIVHNTAEKTSFFCVGDTKQAIYSWRGGVSEIFESVADQIQSVRKEQLVKSFRSSPVIINFVNEVFTQLDKHDKYGSEETDAEGDSSASVLNWVAKNFQPHETAQINLPGYVELRNANIDKESKKAEGEADSERDDYLEEVVDRIAELHREAPHIEIGVLARTNPDIGSIINMLRERGIEASQEGGNPLTDSSAVLLLLSAMKVANHPADSLAYFHVLNSPLQSLFSQTALASSQALSAEIRSWIDAFGYGHTVSELARAIAPNCNARDQDRLRQLIQLAYKFEGIQVNSLYDFLCFVEQQKVATPGANKIRVMTIHQSKGLEFDAVFLPSLERSLVSRSPSFVPMFGDRTKPPIGVSRYISRPLHRYLETTWTVAFREYDQQQMAEALCLFYVALTRAKHALYLYTTPSKNSARRWGSVLQSIFATQDQMLSPGILIHSWGDRGWHAHSRPEVLDSPKLPSNQNTEASPPKSRIRLLGTNNQARILPSIRPSQKEEASLVVLGTQWEAHDPSGVVIGKIIHRWFEEITGWIEDYSLDKAKLKQIAASALTQEEMSQIRMGTWLSKFVDYCEQPGVRSTLSKSRYDAWYAEGITRIEVNNERKLLQVLDDTLLRGVIDRCVVGYQGEKAVRAEIIDFKTDQRPKKMAIQEWIAMRRDYHLPQLAIYRRAIAEQYGLSTDAIRLTLLLLAEDQAVSL